MEQIRIQKEKVMNLSMCYAVAFMQMSGKDVVVCASEGLGGCYVYDRNSLSPLGQVWDNAGGCMSLCQIAQDGTFLAVQNFFKGFNAKAGRLVKATPDGKGGWTVEPFMEYPYLHRFDVVTVEKRKFLIASNLCENKDFKEDWSRPGAAFIGEMIGGTEAPKQMRPLMKRLTKNHGFYRGTHDGKSVVLIAGMEGLFEITVPAHADDAWETRPLIEREISDATFVDLDGDGEEELVTIEGFHGDHIAINKRTDGRWTEVYRYPAPFAHVVWGGSILGKPGLLLAYRNDNGALMLFRKSDRPGGYTMDHLLIDELISPTNLAVDSRRDACRIHCACGKTQEMRCYTLTLA